MHTKPGLQPRAQGIALVSVLAITLMVAALITVLVGLVIRSARITSSDVIASTLVQLADGWSDVGRIALADNFQASKLQVSGWLNLIATNRSTTPVVNPTHAKVVALAGVKTTTTNGVTLRWKIKDVSKTTDSSTWVLIAATAEDAKGRSQTVTRKVQFAGSSVFDLAMLTETTNCMFCHLRVNGDVGSINSFRPGWGTEDSDGQDSGWASSINGNLYVNSTISDDGSDASTANGTTISGERNVNYSGEKLPQNENGQTAFPGLDRQAAYDTAAGSITGGSIKGVAIGGSYSSATTVTTVTNRYSGNLVLIGTDANPITLNGDVYVTGDVVIKGVVKGRGAIYSGRNTYIAGNLTNKSPQDKPGAVGGVCAAITDQNACAKANIAANKDEVRLSAGNNIIMGDFVETKGGVRAGRQDLQANDYIRSQFNLWWAGRYVRKGTGEELRYVAPTPPATTGTYYDQLGKAVPASEVKAITDDPYDDLITPGTTNASGTFSRWMTEDQYRTLLGTESRPNNTWRTNMTKANFDKDAYGNARTDGQTKAAIKQELEKAGLPAFNNSNTAAIVDQIFNGTTGNINYSGNDVGNAAVSGTVYYDGWSLRVAVNEARNYKTESTAVDAFLYANQRIAGKLSQRGGYVNGGVIAREIGILAPGKNDGADWWLNAWPNYTGLDQTTRDKYNKCDTTARPTDSSTDAHKSGTNCDYAINYDYRLRNGGYGFNLYQGKTGTTADWALDLTGSQKVTP